MADPDGWHLPTIEEWSGLKQFIAQDGAEVSAALKSKRDWEKTEQGNGKDAYVSTPFPLGASAMSAMTLALATAAAMAFGGRRPRATMMLLLYGGSGDFGGRKSLFGESESYRGDRQNVPVGGLDLDFDIDDAGVARI